MSLEKKRKELELARVRMARQELEFRIEERMEEMARIRENIEIQIKKEAELNKELEGEG